MPVRVSFTFNFILLHIICEPSFRYKWAKRQHIGVDKDQKESVRNLCYRRRKAKANRYIDRKLNGQTNESIFHFVALEAEGAIIPPFIVICIFHVDFFSSSFHFSSSELETLQVRRLQCSGCSGSVSLRVRMSA